MKTKNKKYIDTISDETKCKWIAFIRAIQIIDRKAIQLGIDPDTVDLPSNQIYNKYIKPESETLEYTLSLIKEDKNKEFFLLSDLYEL